MLFAKKAKARKDKAKKRRKDGDGNEAESTAKVARPPGKRVAFAL